MDPLRQLGRIVPCHRIGETYQLRQHQRIGSSSTGLARVQLDPNDLQMKPASRFNDLLSMGLDQSDLAVEIGLFLGMELEGNAADTAMR